MASRGVMPDRCVSLQNEGGKKVSAMRAARRTSPAGVSRSTHRAASKRDDRDPAQAVVSPHVGAADEPVLPDEVLLQICRTSPDAKSVTPEWLTDFRHVTRLIALAPSQPDPHLEHAMALLVSLLAQLPQYRPTHLPFGDRGPRVDSIGWAEREATEQTGKQIVGLIWEDQQPAAVVQAVEMAIAEAIRVGFLEQQRYDAWRPGMPSGTGWRSAFRATPYGAMKARVPLENSPCVAEPEVRPTVELGRPGEACTVCGHIKKALTHAQYAVASALIDAGEDGLTKDALEAVRPSARRILKTLSKDADWAQVIVMPGQTNGRYRIRT